MSTQVSLLKSSNSRIFVGFTNDPIPVLAEALYVHFEFWLLFAIFF